jgi:hypothetical protein
MIFDSFTPQALRDAIEIELQHTDDAKTASIIALKKLNEDPRCYELLKAKPTKYIKREGSAGHYKYFYTEDETKQQSSWLSIFASLFGFKDKSQAIKKIETDYKVNQLDKKYNLTWDGWKSHLEEYFLHKDKWTAFFSKEKKSGDKKKVSKKETNPKPKRTEKKTGLQLSVMKLIYQLYGNSVPQAQKNNFETMPEEIIVEVAATVPETPEQKKADAKITTIINNVTPETRGNVEREILGIPEPASIEDIETPKVEFVSKITRLTIPYYKKDTGEDFFASDYTDVQAKDIYLINEKNILTTEKPSYIPNIDEDFFRRNLYSVPIVKLGPDKYAIMINNDTRKEVGYAIVNRDILATTMDYYLKLAKAKKKKEFEEIKEKYGISSTKKRRISMLSEDRMTRLQSVFIGMFAGSSVDKWEKYKEIRKDLKQKTEDMEIQIEEYYNAHAKGRETSYGDAGTKDDLLNNYGVKVKRQNGSEIDKNEIEQIKEALDSVFNIFGNRSSMAKKFGLKISHAGAKLMHARQAAGLFLPTMKAIGVTTKYEKRGTGFVLSHEWAHFMDYYLGNTGGRHYLSDNPQSIAGTIASIFRDNMTSKQKSIYQNRTCECFARACEQYWAIKTDNYAAVEQWDTKNHPMREVFEAKIMPLVDKFFQENNELLKAFFKNKIINIRKLG